MKITEPHVIKNGEKDLIEAVTDDLDLDAVKDILKKRMAAAALSSKGGEIIVHNNEIAFRLDFDIQLSGSLMFDRQGNYISESDETGDEEPDDQENLISEDFDLEDIDINETLEEVGPQTLLNDTEDTKIEDNDTGVEEEQSIDEAIKENDEAIEENLNINLPDYDFDDELDIESGDHDESEDENIETQHISETEDNEDTADDDIVDDDISDILEENREFWEPKKDS